MRALVTGLPLDLRFRTKGQLAIDVLAGAYADGLSWSRWRRRRQYQARLCHYRRSGYPLT